MLSFECDYSAGAHPKILAALAATNLEPQPGYGFDRWCASAAEKIRDAAGCPGGHVWYAMGGTQANQLVISTMLASYEGVVAASTGHVSVHEAGAIEHSGHKVLTLPSHGGKIRAGELEALLDVFSADGNRDHMVFPGMAYVTHPTEYGTLYSKAELTEIAGVCRAHGIPLFLDGARLIYGLASPETDVALEDVAALCDVFYIGGTKAGALCGEAVVFPRGGEPRHFLTQIKQRGGLLAKGRLLGVQFDTLFTGGLWREIGAHAAACSAELRRILHAHGLRFFLESPTNQQFVILENGVMKKLAEQVSASFWDRFDDTHIVVRLAVSWATSMEQLHELDRILGGMDTPLDR